jgi:subtilase family serine protease
MLAHGINGTGTTIAVILPAAGPQITGDVRTYSRRYQLPAPDLQAIDWHNAPVASVGNPAAAAGAQEGTLDLEMAHALAPGARLIYMAVTGGSGQAYSTALAWLVTHQHVNVVSFSEGIPEAWVKSTNGGYQTLLSLRDGVQAAARAGVTVVAGTGDYGATQPEDPDEGTLYPSPVALWPASDPLVTAVGGTRLHTGAAGDRVSAGTAFASIGGFAGGAGLSAVFTRPAWQNSVRNVTGSRRGVADVSMDASPCSPVLAYTGFTSPDGQRPGWANFFGTSAAAPLFAGIVADAAQIAGHPLGVLGPALYRMHGPADGVLDVTEGTTTTPALAGYAARPGYDLPTGIGTVGDALGFATALAQQTGGTHPSRAGGSGRP